VHGGTHPTVGVGSLQIGGATKVTLSPAPLWLTVLVEEGTLMRVPLAEELALLEANPKYAAKSAPHPPRIVHCGGKHTIHT
jgi:hypothetical protein